MLNEYPVGVVLLSTDLKRSKAFYAERLQLPVISEDDTAIAYQSGSTRLTVTASETGSSGRADQGVVAGVRPEGRTRVAAVARCAAGGLRHR